MCLCFMCDVMFVVGFFFFFKQKTAYEMRISDWSSDVCSSDLHQNSGIAVEANNRTIGTPHVLGGADDNGAVHIALFHAATRRSFLHRHDNDVAHASKTAL